MGTADSSMRNISQVETYAKSLEQVSRQVEQVFDKLSAQFNENILKQVKGTCATLQRLSDYIKKQCEFHRMAQQQRL